jgi:hypothetical protein
VPHNVLAIGQISLARELSRSGLSEVKSLLGYRYSSPHSPDHIISPNACTYHIHFQLYGSDSRKMDQSINALTIDQCEISLAPPQEGSASA